MRQCENIFVFMDLTKSIGSDLGGQCPPRPPPNSAYGEACGSLDVDLGSFMTSWTSHYCDLGVILGGQSLLGRFTTVPSFLDLWIMALNVVRWTLLVLKALEMAL